MASQELSFAVANEKMLAFIANKRDELILDGCITSELDARRLIVQNPTEFRVLEMYRAAVARDSIADALTKLKL